MKRDVLTRPQRRVYDRWQVYQILRASGLPAAPWCRRGWADQILLICARIKLGEVGPKCGSRF
jgi:hypothetical protein